MVQKIIGTTCLLIVLLSYSTAQNISLTVQTGHSATINKLAFSPDGRILASAGSDNAIVLWDINTGKQLVTLSGHTRKVNDLAFHPRDASLISASDDGSVIIWKYESGEAAQQIRLDFPVKAVAYSFDGVLWSAVGKQVIIHETAKGAHRTLPFAAAETFNTVAFSSDGRMIAFGGIREAKVRIVRLSDEGLVNTFRLQTTQLQFSKDNRFLVASGLKGKLKKWNIENGGLFSTFSATADRIWQSYNSVAIGDQYFFGGNRNNLIAVYSMKSGKKVKVLNGHEQDINALAVSADGSILVSAGEEKKIVFWDTRTWEIVKVLQGTSDKITDIEFTDGGGSLLLSYANGSFRYWQITPGGQMVHNRLRASKWKKFFRWEYSVTDITGITGSTVTMQAYRLRSRKRRNDRYKAKGYEVTWDLRANTYRMRGGRAQRNVVYDDLLEQENLKKKSVRYEASLRGGNDLVVISRETSEDVFSVPHGHGDRVTAVSVDEEGSRIATAGFDGLVRLRDIDTGMEQSVLLASGASDYIFITPDNYYYSTKGALASIGFRINSQIYSFEQFDLKYNRPDLVLDAMNHPDTTIAFAFRKAHERRMRNSEMAAFGETSFEDIPVVEISSRDQSPASSSKKYAMTVRGKKKTSGLDKLFVSVNGVPMYPRGLPVNEEGFEKKIDVELSYGVNKIMYHVVNERGVSSLKHAFQVAYRSQKSQPVLFLVTIGASEYREDRYNLRYAAKDATDIEALFSRSGRFSEVRKVTLLNQDVSLGNIEALRGFLSEASVDDMVLITYAGHGLLDKNLDYYLSLYDTNFDDPAGSGLPFSYVEELLEGVRSRSKILMIDACHSGEIDKEEVEMSGQVVATNAGSISFRNVGSALKNKNGAGLKTTLELSKALFADIKTSHGAMIISSAGGGEYAIEGKEWNNGIFTYCFINGLKSRKSDINRDGKISVSELQHFLRIEVPRLTNGQQTPTSREENIHNNFVIW